MRLVYGSLDLTDDPYSIEFGSDVGAPQNVVEAYAFLLQDGEIELSDRASNRTLAFNVIVEGADLAEMADAEAALIAETEKPLNTVTIDPGDFGPASVYETYRGQVTLVRDDDWELNHLRRYSVTVRAMPFARSDAEVIAPALAASGTTTTLVDNGSATTNWTGTTNGAAATVNVSSGAVGMTTASLSGDVTIALTRTASITTSATKYLVVDWKGSAGTGPSLRAYGDGVELTKVAESPSPTAGYTRTWFYVTAASVAALRLDSLSSPSWNPALGGVARTLYVDNIDRTDVVPVIGSGRQLLRSISIAGSAPTTGSIAIEHSTNALGDVMAYFWPDDSRGYSPPLRQFRTSGGAVTSDAAMVSGAHETVAGTTVTYQIPASRLFAGLHLLMLRVAVSNPATVVGVTYTATTLINGTDVGASVTGPTRSLTFSDTNYAIFTIGRLLLPTRDLDPASAAVVQIQVSFTGAGSTLDEAWLFNIESGDLIGPVACGTGAAASGGPARRLFLEATTVYEPRPTLRIGHAADRSDSFFPATLRGWQFPRLKPDRVSVLTVTTNTTDASVTLRHKPTWHTHAAQ